MHIPSRLNFLVVYSHLGSPTLQPQAICLTPLPVLLLRHRRVLAPYRPRLQITMATVLDQFLAGIGDLVKRRDGAKLQDFLQIEPPLPDIYRQMVNELRQRYPSEQDAELQRRCEGLVSRAKGGSPWPAFPIFMKLYFAFLRDVNVDNLLETYDMLKGLLK